MGLITCKDCGAAVSTDAAACPRCGAFVQAGTGMLPVYLGIAGSMIAGIAVLLLILFLIIHRSLDDAPTLVTARTPKEKAALAAYRELMDEAKAAFRKRRFTEAMEHMEAIKAVPHLPATYWLKVNETLAFWKLAYEEEHIAPLIGEFMPKEFEAYKKGQVPDVSPYPDSYGSANLLLRERLRELIPRAEEIRAADHARRREEWGYDQFERWLETLAKNEEIVARLAEEERIRTERDKIIGEAPKSERYETLIRTYHMLSLLDPGSVRYIRWHPPVIVTVKDEPYWAVRVCFRAKTRIGNEAYQEQTFLFRHGDVVHIMDD